MIFDELYGAYYNAVARILRTAAERAVTRQEARRIIEEQAFSESVLAIEPALFEGQWQLLRPDGTTPVRHKPELPFTGLEKRWLKAISLDPRIRLFDCEFAGLEETEPLFTPEDICVFDQYADGDPYEDEEYIRHFRTILDAVKKRIPLRIDVLNRKGTSTHMVVMPEYLEYSEKDDKFRLITTGCRYGRTVNLAKILACRPCPPQEGTVDGRKAEKDGICPSHLPRTGAARWREEKESAAAPAPRARTAGQEHLVFELFDGRNALERALLHFAHFEKEAERLDGRHYRVRVSYNKEDETELVIRVLSFGPFLKVVEPEAFTELIRNRLRQQQMLGPSGVDGGDFRKFAAFFP